MKEQFHSKIHQLIQRSADGRLTPSQQQALDAHLAGCAECRAYAAELRALETQLASVSVTRLVPPASRQASLTAPIHKRYRRYQMNKQILSFAGTLAILAAVAVLIVLFGHIVPRQSSPAAAPSATAANEMPTVTIAISTPTSQSQPLGYFIHAESDTRPVETRVPGANTTPDSIESTAPNLSIAEAAQRAGFEVLAPTWLPDFLVLEGASFWPKQHIFEIVYGVAPNDPNENTLALMEQPIPENSDDCIIYPIACSMLVGASATIEEVQIGDIPAEYVANGVWQAIDDSGQWGWDATPPIQKLRWHANGVAFELSTIIDGFSKKDLITIAENLSYFSQTMAASIATVEAQVGYSPKTLTSLPAGYVFSQVDVNQPSNSVCVKYSYTGNDGPGPELWLAEGPMAAVPGLVARSGFTGTQQIPVVVGGAQQAYSLYGMQRGGEWACVQPQAGSDPVLLLTWQADGQQFDLYAMPGKCLGKEGLSDLDLLRLAEGVTGVSTHTSDEIDPECTSDIAAIETLVGFQALLPQAIPGGMEFYGASYSGAPSKEIRLYYKLPTSNHTGLWIQQVPVNPELGNDLASQYRDLPTEGYQLLTIAGVPAVMILGDWVLNDQGVKVWYQAPGFAPTLWFEKDGLLIAISGPWLADSGGNPQEVLVAIAESLR